jgi:glutamate-1-semialdehyde 2,1-aminomutase
MSATDTDRTPTAPTRPGIVTWPDADAIEARCRDLVAQPIRPITREHYDDYLAWFESKAAQSKAAADEAQRYIPGGVQHNLAFNRPFALEITKAEGAHLWDIDGNRYIDFLQAGGPTVLGSNYAPVREKVVEVLESSGPVTGLFHDYEVKLARLIHDVMPSIETFRMLGSGTEGVIAAIRAARASTGKTNIVKVGGAYHGWSDQMVFALRLPGTGALEASGIPEGCYAHTQEVYPNDIDELRSTLQANEDTGGTAAVIVEPPRRLPSFPQDRACRPRRPVTVAPANRRGLARRFSRSVCVLRPGGCEGSRQDPVPSRPPVMTD